MESFDEIYDSLGTRIMREGVTQDDTMSIRAKYADGTPATTKSVEGVSFCITPSMGVPILESKRVPVKTPLIELEWIWQEMSNEVSWLNERGVRIWDSWSSPSSYYITGRDIVLLDRKHTEEVYGEPTTNGVLLEKTPINEKLARHWRTMMARVYSKTGRKATFYRNRGVQVHPDWWDVNNFVEDVKTLPNFEYKQHDWDRFVLDKDYYGGNIYSKHTCVWLPQEENVLYQDAVYPIKVTDNTGFSVEYLGIKAVSETFGIPTSTVHRFIEKGCVLSGLKRDNIKFNGYLFSKLDVPSGKVARLSLVDGTIGKAYGWQLKNKKRLVSVKSHYAVSMNQVQYVLHELINNPSSRRIMTTLWDVDDLLEMALEPCVWATHWTVHDGKLNLHVKQR